MGRLRVSGPGVRCLSASCVGGFFGFGSADAGVGGE